MANDLEYSLGLDVSPMQKAGASIAKFGDDTVKVLNRKFSGADLFKGVLQGIGIASVNQIADRLIQPFKESAESAERIATYTDRAASATEKLIGLRQTDAQQLSTMEKQYKKIADEANRLVEPSFWQKVAGSAAAMMGLTGLAADAFGNNAGNAENKARVAAELAEKGLQIEQKKKAMAKEADDDSMKVLRDRARSDAERAASQKELADIASEERMSKMTDEEMAAALQKEKADVDKEIAKYAKFQKEGGELTNEGTKELVALKKKQKGLETEIVTLTKDKQNGEKAIGEVVDSNIEKWENLKGSINSFGRGNKDLSDRELQRKILATNADIAKRNASGLVRFGPGGTAGYDPLLQAQKSNLAQALAEQNFRDSVRRDVSVFGSDQAFAMNPGLTEQRFAEIMRGYLTDQEKLTKSIDTLNRNVQAIPPALQSLNNAP